MAIKEILDILGENPTESVYSEGKDFVTKKIKLYIDKKKLENYVKETYNRRTKVPFQSLLTSGHINPKWRKLKGRHLLGAVF